MVLNGFRGRYAYINDPARGEVKVPMEEFDRSFTGICLEFKPGENFVPGGRRKSTLAFARKRLRGAGAAVVFVMLTTVIGYLFGIINPIFSRFFMDRLLTGENRELLMPFLGLLALMGLAQIAIAWIQAIYSRRINGKMAVVGSSTFMWKVLRMPMEFFSQRLSGDILQRQGTNSTIASVLVNTFAPLLLNTAMMIVYLVFMLRYSVMLTIVGIVTILLNLLVSQLISAKRVNISRVQMRDSDQRTAVLRPGEDRDMLRSEPFAQPVPDRVFHQRLQRQSREPEGGMQGVVGHRHLLAVTDGLHGQIRLRVAQFIGEGDQIGGGDTGEVGLQIGSKVLDHLHGAGRILPAEHIDGGERVEDEMGPDLAEEHLHPHVRKLALLTEITLGLLVDDEDI